MLLIDTWRASLRTFPSARTGRVPLLHPRLLGFLRIQTSAPCSMRVKTGGSVPSDLCSHLEVHWLERTSRLVYVQLSFLKHFPYEKRSHVKPPSRMCPFCVYPPMFAIYVSASAHGRACLLVSTLSESRWAHWWEKEEECSSRTLVVSLPRRDGIASSLLFFFAITPLSILFKQLRCHLFWGPSR